MNDKEIMFIFFEKNKSNIDLYKITIVDFMTLINFLINRKEENVSISEMNSHIENNISPEFIRLFEDKKDLTIS